MPQRDVRVRVRCTEETKVEFDEFLAGYSVNEQGLRDILEVYRNFPSLFKRRRGK